MAFRRRWSFFVHFHLHLIFTFDFYSYKKKDSEFNSTVEKIEILIKALMDFITSLVNWIVWSRLPSCRSQKSIKRSSISISILLRSFQLLSSLKITNLQLLKFFFSCSTFKGSRDIESSKRLRDNNHHHHHLLHNFSNFHQLFFHSTTSNESNFMNNTKILIIFNFHEKFASLCVSVEIWRWETWNCNQNF